MCTKTVSALPCLLNLAPTSWYSRQGHLQHCAVVRFERTQLVRHAQCQEEEILQACQIACLNIVYISGQNLCSAWWPHNCPRATSPNACFLCGASAILLLSWTERHIELCLLPHARTLAAIRNQPVLMSINLYLCHPVCVCPRRPEPGQLYEGGGAGGGRHQDQVDAWCPGAAWCLEATFVGRDYAQMQHLAFGVCWGSHEHFDNLIACRVQTDSV